MAKIAPARVTVIDPFSLFAVWLAVILLNSTTTLVAFKYHGHPLAQAWLLLK